MNTDALIKPVTLEEAARVINNEYKFKVSQDKLVFSTLGNNSVHVGSNSDVFLSRRGDWIKGEVFYELFSQGATNADHQRIFYARNLTLCSERSLDTQARYDRINLDALANLVYMIQNPSEKRVLIRDRVVGERY